MKAGVVAFNKPVNLLPPIVSHATYNNLLPACPSTSQPKLIAVFQDLIHTRAVLCTHIEERFEEGQAKEQEQFLKE
jgi:hypothetical protein